MMATRRDNLVAGAGAQNGASDVGGVIQKKLSETSKTRFKLTR